MRRSLTRAVVSWPWQGATSGSGRLFLYLCVSLLLLAVMPAWGSPGRMVLVNGKLHRILRNNDNQIQYARGHADKDWSFDAESITLPALPGPWPCRTWIPTYKGGGSSGVVETFAAEGLAVFENKIWVAFTADASCSDPSSGMAAYVAAFDLRATQDAPDGQWIRFTGGKGDGSTTAVQYNSLGKGSAHTDTAAQGWGSGAAIAVFDNQLYVFTDNGVYTSGDGVLWTYQGRPFSITPQQEPLDAVTINAPDGQRILIVYGFMSGKNYHYDHLDSVDWNGQFGSTSQERIYNNWVDPSGHFVGRVSLSLGTKASGNGLGAGALDTAVQLFGQSGEEFTTSHHNPARNAEYVYTSIAAGWGSWRWDSNRVLYFDHTNPSLMLYPWSTPKCDSHYPARQALAEYMVLVGGFNWWTTKTPFVFSSDYLLPQHYENVTAKCTDPVTLPPGVENTTEQIKKDYWTLVGVILGSPPFSDNGTEDDVQIGQLSSVNYDQTISSSTTTTSTMENTATLSIGRKITAGLFDMFHFSKSFDASYKHTWEKESGTTSSETIQIKDEYGTGTEDKSALGYIGWGLFSAPHVFVQDWTAYAYDYKYNASSGGTALNLDLQTLSTSGTPDYIPESFDLRNPASNPVFQGMASFEYTDIYENADAKDFWLKPFDRSTGTYWNWQNDPRWETRLGDGTSTWYQCKDTVSKCTTQILASSGSHRTISYDLSGETMTGSGHTNEVEVTAGASMGGEVELEGFSVGLDKDISVGYDGKFAWNTETTTGVGTEIGAGQLTNNCTEPSCYSSVRVRAFWLHPVTTENVPWLPTAYASQLPWCLTWNLTSACHYGEKEPCGQSGAPPIPPNATSRGSSGTALPPTSAFGRIVNGAGGGAAADPYSHYSIKGGHMAWLTDEAAVQRIPMTADEFVPSRGVSLEVNRMFWSSSGNGAWKRNGNVWSFQTDPSAQPRVSLDLDFGSATYDLEIQKANFSGVVAGVTNTRLVLTVNQRYSFYSALNHDIDISWRWSRPPANSLAMHVTSSQGRYNSANQSGHMSIAGTLPKVMSSFGDIELDVNAHPYIARLITMDGFQQAFESEGVFKYARGGVVLVLDFGKKTWSATFNQQAFHRLLSPRWGSVRARIKVGGVPWMTQDNAVADYSANLTLARH